MVGSDIGVVAWFPFLFQHDLAIFCIPGAGFAEVYHRTQELRKYSIYTRVSQTHHWTKGADHQTWQLGFFPGIHTLEGRGRTPAICFLATHKHMHINK